MEISEARIQLKESWKKIVYDFSDTVSLLGVDVTKKKLKLLNKIIDAMILEDIITELQENKEFIEKF